MRQPHTVGKPRTPAPGFLLDRGRFTRFDVPEATTGTSAGDVNNSGEYNAGTTSSGPGADEHGFVRDRRGNFTRIDLPGARATTPLRGNDRGRLTDIAIPDLAAQPLTVQGFLRRGADYTTIRRAPVTFVADINNRGQLSGTTADDITLDFNYKQRSRRELGDATG